jgi:hypothetical protein
MYRNLSLTGNTKDYYDNVREATYHRQRQTSGNKILKKTVQGWVWQMAREKGGQWIRHVAFLPRFIWETYSTENVASRENTLSAKKSQSTENLL